MKVSCLTLIKFPIFGNYPVPCLKIVSVSFSGIIIKGVIV